MASLPLNFAYHCCSWGGLRALSESLPRLCLNFVSNLNKLSPIDLFALFHLVDIVKLEMKTRPLLILCEALSELASHLFLHLHDRLFAFQLDRSSQLLRQHVQFLSLVRLKLKKALDLRFLDVHDLCNLLPFLLSEILHVNGGESLDWVRALREHGFDPLDKLRLSLQVAQFIRIIFEERALLSLWRVKFHIAVEHGNLIFDPSGLVS